MSKRDLKKLREKYHANPSRVLAGNMFGNPSIDELRLIRGLIPNSLLADRLAFSISRIEQRERPQKHPGAAKSATPDGASVPSPAKK